MKGIETGQKYTALKDIKPLCCKNIIPKGSEIEVIKFKSPKRIFVKIVNRGEGIHKIKTANLVRKS